MEILNLKIDEVIPYENNPRNNEGAVEYVAESIKQFGFKVPIVIDKDNVIVTGHTRHKAAKRLGMETVPCIKADDLTENQIKAFRLADNKVSEYSTWDLPLLTEELADLEDIEMFDFGFENYEEIDWAEVDELDATTYEKPEKDMLECPHCHHIDSKIHFKKVDGLEIAERLSGEE